MHLWLLLKTSAHNFISKHLNRDDQMIGFDLEESCFDKFKADELCCISISMAIILFSMKGEHGPAEGQGGRGFG